MDFVGLNILYKNFKGKYSLQQLKMILDDQDNDWDNKDDHDDDWDDGTNIRRRYFSSSFLKVLTYGCYPMDFI